MSINFRKVLMLILCITLCVCLSPAVFAAEPTLSIGDAETFAAAKGLAVSAANFPDPAFRSYVEQFCDQDGDLVLTAEEIADVTRMDVRGKGISSLEGIEAFSSLVTLNCSDNNLRELNVSDLPRLEQLYCQENYRAGEKGQEQTGLALLVPSGALKELWCYNNNLTGEALNLALCPELAYLDCSINPIGSLDLSPVPHLSELRCFGAGLTSLDLSHTPDLCVLWCWFGEVGIYEVSYARNLNRIDYLDLSVCPKLADVVVHGIREDYYRHVAFFDGESEVSVTAQSAMSDYFGIPDITLYLGEEYGSIKVIRDSDGENDETPVVAIDEEHFPDEAFRNTIAGHDLDGDGWLNGREISRVKSLNLNNDYASLEGIRYLTKLESLDVSGGMLTALDLDGFANLKNLYLSGGSAMRSINLRGCTGLSSVTFRSYGSDFEKLTVVDAHGCTGLKELQIYNSPVLAKLDVSGCISLETLYCASCQLTELNLDGCTSLSYLNCYANQLAALDLSDCAALEGLNCANNQLAALDLDVCPALEELRCSNNRLPALDMSDRSTMRYLDCGSNEMTSLNVTGCPALTELYCCPNKLTALDLRDVTALRSLDCSNNRLTALDLSACTALESAVCADNALTSLNVSGCTALNSLQCGGNAGLRQLSVSDNPALTKLNCSGDGLSALSVENNSLLTELNCSDNDLSTLNIDSCPELAALSCEYNRLTTLDIGANPQLLKAVKEGTAEETDETIAYSCRLENVSYYSMIWQYTLRTDRATELLTAEKDPGFLAVHFPDASFRKYVRDHFDLDGNSLLSAEELSAVTEMDISRQYIADLTGIELFTELRVLNCSWNMLKHLDVSMMPHLEELYCYSNCSDSMTIYANTPTDQGPTDAAVPAVQDQETFDAPVTTGGLESLVVGSAPLKVLWCYDNGLTQLDVSRCAALEYLDCAFNRLGALDVSGLPKLSTLMCHDNDLASLDVSANSELTCLWCWNNAFDTLDITPCPMLVNAAENGIKEMFLDHVSLFTREAEVSISTDAVLITGTVPEGVAITEETFPDENFRAVIRSAADADYNGVLTDDEIAALTYLNCSGQQISSIAGLEYLTNLRILRCGVNGLTEIDTRALENLMELDCSYNRISSLDLSGNPMLLHLRTVGNDLGELDISANGMLRNLWCWNNHIAVLDLRTNPTLSNLAVNGVTERYGGGTNWYYDDEGEYHEYEVPGYTSYFDKGGTSDLSVDDSTQLLGVRLVDIDEEHFPDAGFRSYVAQFDLDSDGALSREEIAGVKEIFCTGLDLSSLKGLEYFTALESLDCRDNRLTALDISANTALRVLICSGNQLSTLDTGRNPALRSALCSDNRLESVRFSNNYELEQLDCSGNLLKTINVIDCDSIADYLCTDPTPTISGNTCYYKGEFQREGEDVRNMYFCFDRTTAIWTGYPEPDCVLPDNLESIGEEAFACCSFTCVKLGENVRTINARAFADSPALSAVYIPAGVTEIAPDAFERVPGLVIVGSYGSAAETYARANDIPFYNYS